MKNLPTNDQKWLCYRLFKQSLKLMMEDKIGQSIGLAVVSRRYLLVRGDMPQDLVCENSRLHKSIMRKMRTNFKNNRAGKMEWR